MDGGGRLDKIRHVTWPSIEGTFVILFILACGKIMSGGGSTFEQVYILGNPLNYDYSDIFATNILRVGLQGGRLSYASAVGLFQGVVNLILLLAANRMSRSVSGKGLY
jgi:putative aldouronate transport system permease protein